MTLLEQYGIIILLMEGREKNFMNRNVTEFKHLLGNSHATENDLNWVIGLRENPPAPKLHHTESVPPEVFFKSTASAKFRAQRTKNSNKSSIVPNQYSHIYLKQPQRGHHQTEQQVRFYSSLRKQTGQGAKSGPKSEFSTIPFKERGNVPTFIKRQFTKKMKAIGKNEVESGLDGAHKQDPYTLKLLQVKNYGVLSSFTKARGRNQVSLPSLAWQVGLRNYP